MITDRYLTTSDGGLTWSLAPEDVLYQGYWHKVADLAAREEWSILIAANPPVYREWKEQGTAWLGYDDPIIQDNPEPEDDIAVAAVYFSGTTEERAQAQREDIRNQIESNRLSSDVINIDLSSDSARQVLMDEANDQANAKVNELAATLDADLDVFDPTLNPLQIGSLATARSLYQQTAQVLATDPTLDAQQTTDLQNLQSQYAQIVIDDDDTATVPKPTNNVRLKLGVVAEGFGSIQCRRFEDGAWWWLEFELRTNRELSVSDYWIAVYSEGTYLTTPFLTEVAPNVYQANRLAVNLPHTPPKQYEYTLCHQHITNEMFDPITLAADANEKFDLVRWGGSAS